MPELPEVESLRLSLEPRLEGRSFDRVIVRERRLRQSVPAALETELPGRRIAAIARRGKYLLIRAGADTLLIHLGMSGSLRWQPLGSAPRRHDHVDFVLGGEVLRYHDPRRFGLIAWCPGTAEDHPLIASLGREPLEPGFDGAWLHRMSRGRGLAIKVLLMDSHWLVGVGNIYASESLFRARIRPTTVAGRLSLARASRLAGAIREVLSEAIAAGGSTLRDYVGSDGTPGHFQKGASVYGRAGEPCRVCGTAIRQIRLAGRASYWCPHCQH